MKRSSSDPADDKWLAYELHDGLIQWIFGARMLAEATLKELEAAGESSASEKLRQAIQNLDSATNEGRTLIQFLEQGGGSAAATSLGEKGDLVSLVASALLRLAKETQDQEIASEFSENCPDLSPRIRWNLFRIIEQAIANAIQHAGPCAIKVAISIRTNAESSGQELVAIVADSGVGYDQDVVKSDRFGLTSQRHRAKEVGATLKIESKVGSGTRVELVYPIR